MLKSTQLGMLPSPFLRYSYQHQRKRQKSASKRWQRRQIGSTIKINDCKMLNSASSVQICLITGLFSPSKRSSVHKMGTHVIRKMVTEC